MEQVKNFLSKHDKDASTEVNTGYAAPVTQEKVHGHEHTKTAEAVDRERHISHHQHRVLPVNSEVHEDTKHEHTIQPEVTRETKTEMAPEKRELLEGLKSQHKDTRTVGETEHTGESVGTTVNEHTHHTVSETIQPLIQKETHQHKTIHNVIPVHEKVHEAPIVHESTVLPAVSMDEFKNKLAGNDSHESRTFDGEPKGSDQPATEGVLGSHGAAGMIGGKHGDDRQRSSAESAERV